jgi:hypothetical protein
MNKPTPLGKKSYAEYEREMKKFKNLTEVNLNKIHKINLGVVDDIESEYSWLEQSYSEASYGIDFMQEWYAKIQDFNSELSIAVDNYVVNGAAMSFEEAYTNMRPRIEQVERTAEELGLNPEDLVSNYSEIKEILSNAEQVDEDFVDAYKEVLKEANERFGLANFA